jgi:AcrR family transcriptional regulator
MPSSVSTLDAPSRRAQIAQVAARAFSRAGYGSASIRDIAAEVGVTPAALYHHFGTKEEILYELISGFTDDLVAMIRRELGAADDPTEGLRRVLLAHIRLLETRRVETRLVIDEKKHLGPARLRRIVNGEREVYALYRDTVRAIIDSGRGRRLDPAVVTFALFGIVNHFHHWFRPGGALTLREAAEQSIALVLDGLLIDSAGRVPRRGRADGKRTRDGSVRGSTTQARQT